VRPFFVPFAAASLAGCGAGGPTLELFYEDELVEAPTRSVEVFALRSESCDEVLSESHRSLEESGRLLLERSFRYPLSPDTPVFEDLPGDESLALSVVGYDSTLLRISRGCTVVKLDRVDTIRMELRALPSCRELPTKLDVMLVIDTSEDVALADPDGAHIMQLLETVLDPTGALPETRWGVVTFGHDDRALELVELTTDLERVRTAVADLASLHSGPTRLFDGVAKGTALLRARAVCPYLPAVVLISSSSDGGSALRFEDARIGVFAGREDREDDIFVFGLALSEPAFADLDDLIPEGERGSITRAASPDEISLALREARSTLNGLLR
jgi:hypothetical protein